LGRGSYGSVAAFWDTTRNERVAVKKVSDVFTDLLHGIRTLREIRVLNSASHCNIVEMRGYYCDQRLDLVDVYIIQECADIDLHSVLRRSGEQLTEKHHRHILYGITRGLAHLHDMDVAHRDLKPANILVNTNCSVKLCDFNLARGGMQGRSSYATGCAESEHRELSNYVCTRWYRAPELMLFKGRYGTPLDIWSLGCIFCEIINLKPLFKGSNSNDQVRQIINIMGFPAHEDLAARTLHTAARKFLRSLRSAPGHSWQSMVPSATSEGLDMISQLLQFFPEKRITAKECLHHGYFSKLYRAAHEDCTPSEMDWSFDEPASTEGRLRELFSGSGCAIAERPENPMLSPQPLLRGTLWTDIADDDLDGCKALRSDQKHTTSLECR